MDNQKKEAVVLILNVGQRKIFTDSGEISPKKKLNVPKSEADKLVKLFGEDEILVVADSHSVIKHFTGQDEQTEDEDIYDEKVNEDPIDKMTKKELLELIKEEELDIDIKGMNVSSLRESVKSLRVEEDTEEDE